MDDDDDMSMEEKMGKPWNQWNPPPLVSGNHVFSWTTWKVILEEAVEIPGSVQVTFSRLDGFPDIIFRDPLLQGTVGTFLKKGKAYGIIGLGERIVAQDAYRPEEMYAFMDNTFYYSFLTQGYVGGALQKAKGSSFSREEKERRRNVFNLLREIHFWTCMDANVFASEAEKQEGIEKFRREANDVAVVTCRDAFRFNGAKFRDYRLPRLEGGGERILRT